MKYIILKTQEARKFEDLGGLTITKQFKPAPPYIEGAVLEQTDGGNWRLVDDTGRPIEGEDGLANFCPVCTIREHCLHPGTVDSIEKPGRQPVGQDTPRGGFW